jgi:hypothetical protein
LDRTKALHERDVAAGAGAAPLPHALARKYPTADREWGWQYVFPSKKLTVADDGVVRGSRHPPSTGSAGSQECGDDDDLHTRDTVHGAGSVEPTGRSVMRDKSATTCHDRSRCSHPCRRLLRIHVTAACYMR